MSVVPPQLVADRYRLVEPLGQGGMGRVWKARDEVLHRDVAIKELVPPPGLTNQERREMRERSLREARAIARLNHINVVRVFDVLRTDGDPWIVMEYVPSRSLQDVLATDGPVSSVRAAEIGLGVLGALRSAHLSGVMHRDVKPGNVLLGHDGRVVLTDFGLATVPGDPNVTRTGLVLGSPAYIAPERARTGSAGPEGDLWSLGATLYAAVEGQSPYARPTAIATLSALATEPPPPARRAGPLKPVLAGLLRKDPLTRMRADEAERLLIRATGRGPRRGRSLLDGVRRPSPFGPRESRSEFVPGPRTASTRTPIPPSDPGSPPPVAPLPTALPVVPGPAKYGRVSPPSSADPTAVVSAPPPAGETTVLPKPDGPAATPPAAETSVLPVGQGGDATAVVRDDATAVVRDGVTADDQTMSTATSTADATGTGAPDAGTGSGAGAPGKRARSKRGASRTGPAKSAGTPPKGTDGADVDPKSALAGAAVTAATATGDAKQPAAPADDSDAAGDPQEPAGTVVPQVHAESPESAAAPENTGDEPEGPGGEPAGDQPEAGSATDPTTVDGTAVAAHPVPAGTAAPAAAAAAVAAPRDQNWSRPALLVDRVSRTAGSIPRAWLLGGVAGVLVLVLLVTVALLSGGDEGERRGQVGTGPARSSAPTEAAPPTSAAPSAEPTLEPTSNVTPSPSVVTSAPDVPPPVPDPVEPPEQDGDLPAGWKLHRDSTGFAVPVPEGWSVSRDRTRVEFRENGGLGRLIIIDQTNEPKADPVADWESQEQNRRSGYRDYERVRIVAVDYYLRAADWEFRYTSNRGNRLQVLNRGFVTAPDQAYSIYWSTTAERWEQDLSYFELMASRFQPAGS